MKNNTIRRVLGGLAVAVLGSSLANASSITWYNNIFTAPDSPTSASSSPLGAPNQYAVPWSSTVTIPTFNQTGDTPNTYKQLTSVQIVMNWVMTGEVDVFNNSASNLAFTNATGQVPLLITGPDGSSFGATGVAGPISGTANCCNTITSFPGLTGSGTQNYNVIGGGLSSYEAFYNGTQTYSLSFTAQDGTFGGTGGSGHLFYGGSATTGAGVVVTYNYDVVTIPEPGSFVMLGSALLGLGVLIRKRIKA